MISKKEWLLSHPPSGGVDPTPLSGTPAPTSAPAPAASPAPAGQPAAGIPDKFKDAKLEDVIKSYTELEGKFGEQGKKLGALSEYEKYGKPNEVGEAITWARDVYGKMQRGELSPRQAQQAIQNGPQSTGNGPTAPWTAEGWDFLPPAEQAAKMSAYNQQEVMSKVEAIAAQYGRQIQDTFQQLRSTQSREQSLMLQTLQAAMASGGKVDIKKALENAAEMANLPPEELINRAIQNMVNPEDTKAEIERQVTARMAEEKQKLNNENLDNLNHSASQTPRFAQNLFKNRQEENRSIMETLQKQGIRLS